MTTTTTEAPPDTAQEIAVRLRSLTKGFGDRTVLDGVDLEVRRGEILALLGPSGTGKTTLLRILSGLTAPDDGEVLVPSRRTTVYQEPRLVPARRVLANVTLGQRGGAATRAAAERALSEVGLAGRGRAWPGTLSGGEAQRVALARALVREPELLLLDEPFAALDALTRIRTQDLVAELHARHRPAVLLVTHDVDEAVRLADRIIVLKDGRVRLDRRVETERPRRRDDPAALSLARDLLAELGVTTSPPTTPSHREP
ncbi:ABC transporter ATP-binding protein [Nocardiopsis alba]|uniref:ABC transporter ATP-binding protein n=1 Tax=Nocardiopsis alba TaxID=53437 RepID=UPI00366A63EB